MVVRIASALIVLLAFGATQAAVIATVDRERVEQNESFTLELIVDRNTDASPDIAVLEEDFFVGQTSQLSNTRIDNGVITRVAITCQCPVLLVK